MKETRFGLVGCGRVGSTADDRVRKWAVADFWLPYAHASAITATPGARLVAACDSNVAALEDASQRHGPLSTYVDYEQMLQREDIDVLAIATRTAVRKGVILAAARHKLKGLYCEKPLSNSLEDADALVDAVESTGMYFVYGTKRRYMPTFQRVKQRLAGGELGELVSIVIKFGFGSLFWTYPHAVDIASYFADDAEVESVQADLVLDNSLVSKDVVDADPQIRSATIRFRNGVSAVIVPGGGMDIEIAGRDGLVKIEADGNLVRWRRMLAGGSDVGWYLSDLVDERDGASSGTQKSIAALVDAINTGAYPDYSIRHALINQEVLFAMVESHLRGGIRISLPLARRGLTITGRTGTLLA